MNANNQTLILRYPSPNLKVIKKDPIENQQKVDTTASYAKIPSKDSQVLVQSQSNSGISNKFQIKNITNDQNENDLLNSKLPETNKEMNKLINLTEKLNFENNTLKRKLQNIEDRLNDPNLFKNTVQILDFKLFIKTNFDRFNDLLNEVYSNKKLLETEQTTLRNLEIQKENIQKNSLKNKNTETLNKKSINLIEKKEKVEKQILNFQQELSNLKEKNQQYKEKLTKSNFFSEYDAICKEVDELRKTNYSLTETLKKYIPVQDT